MIEWISISGLLLLVVANSAPVALSWIAGPSADWPLDFGLSMADGRRVLGAHKTWRGLAVAIIATGCVALCLDLTFGAGAAFGAAAMLGDGVSSFIKRRLNTQPGAWVPGLDQLPEAALPLWIGRHSLGLDAGALLGTMLVFSGLGMLASRTLGSSRRPSRHD